MTRKYESHGMTNHRAYRIFRAMKTRCTNRNLPCWPAYGGRGIGFSEDWLLFENFWRDMGPTYQDDLKLERVDNDKGYSKQNCKWASQREQCRNKRDNHRIETEWGNLTVTEASERSGVKPKRIFKRIYLGWPTDRLFDEPSAHYAMMAQLFSRTSQ